MSEDTVWTADMDAKLRAGRERKAPIPFSALGASIGVTKNAAIGRWHRISGTLFPYDIELGRLTMAQRAARAAEKRKHEDAGLRALASALAQGKSKGEAVATARKRGATLESIAKHFGVTKQAVHQSSSAWM